MTFPGNGFLIICYKRIYLKATSSYLFFPLSKAIFMAFIQSNQWDISCAVTDYSKFGSVCDDSYFSSP